MNSAIFMFEKTARTYPQKPAIKDKNRELSFSELRQESLEIASSIFNFRAPVIICLEKSVEAIACMLGSLYAGTFYIPINYDIPLLRFEGIVKSFKNPIIITDAKKRLEFADFDFSVYEYSELLGADILESDIKKSISEIIDSDPICVLHTSGSTGVPKGVVLSHRGVIDYVEWLRDAFKFDENTVLGNQSPFYFDNSIFDIYSMALTGAKMVIIPEILARFTKKQIDFLREEKINTIFWVPTVLISIANDDSLKDVDLPELKNVIFAGEVMPNKQLNIWRKNLPNCLYANLYGPTEITVDCTYYIVDREFEDDEILPIGKPCKNVKILILKEDGTQAKKAEKGLIHVGGTGVAKGYWNNPEKTKEVFIKNPLCPYFEEIIYNTGDIGYLDNDDNIIFVGRRDSQIQFRGNRVELGEIENAAKALPVLENAIAVFDEEADDIVLIAETKEKLILRKINLELKRIIPPFMLPTKLFCMPELPKTSNKKIDRVYLKKYIKEMKND